ncbi:response regulator [Planctomycetota bacterium]|nr:response regulator [Planctomycetota bacterium]
MQIPESILSQLALALKVYAHVARPRKALPAADVQALADESTTCGRYVLRLGNHLYPHMKLAMQQSDDNGDWYFHVDAHDDAPAPISAQCEAWEVLRQRNAEIAAAVHCAWELAGVPVCPRTTAQLRAPETGIQCLVVDDSRDSRDALSGKLRALGHDVVSVGSALAALAQIARQRPDVIFSDFEMPGTNGRQLALHLKRLGNSTSIPVVICTYSRTESSQLQPADSILRRPVTTTMIRATMNSLPIRRAA